MNPARDTRPRVPERMAAWTAGDRPGEMLLHEIPVPRPLVDEILVRVDACGLCRTDLHVLDGELPARKPHVVPGHQVVGSVVAAGVDAHRFAVGDRVGVAWLRRSCGVCAACRSGAENLCTNAEFTGWNHDGGFAEYVTVPEGFAYQLDERVDATAIAPLLCAGIIGYRALRRASLPDGGLLGIFGYGSSGAITAAIARARGARIAVASRGERDRALARAAGAVFVGDADQVGPEPLDSAIIFAPVGDLVPVALRAVRSGGTVVLAGIHMSAIPSMPYALLFGERDLRTVTANTRRDGEAFLQIARTLDIRPHVTKFPMRALPDAVEALRTGAAGGSIVLSGW